jgi:hypothetical protein
MRLSMGRASPTGGRKTQQRHPVYDVKDPRHKVNRRLNLMRINESAFFP